MKFYVKTWSQNQVTLMTELGHVLGYYESISEALNTCNEWYMMNRQELKHQVNIQADDIELLCDSSTAI